LLAIPGFARAGALLVTAGSLDAYPRHTVDLVARHRLPAMYHFRFYVELGRLACYAPARRSPCRTANKVRTGDQPQDRQGPRPRDPAVAPAAGGSRDRRAGRHMQEPRRQNQFLGEVWV